jgi:hypothetical protein
MLSKAFMVASRPISTSCSALKKSYVPQESRKTSINTSGVNNKDKKKHTFI